MTVERFDPLDVHLGEFPDRQLPGTQVRSDTGKRGTIQLGEGPEGTTGVAFEELTRSWSDEAHGVHGKVEACSALWSTV